MTFCKGIVVNGAFYIFGKVGNNTFRKDDVMIEQDTIKLLRECDAGVKMGVSSIDDVLKYVYSSDLKNSLVDSTREFFCQLVIFIKF